MLATIAENAPQAGGWLGLTPTWSLLSKTFADTQPVEWSLGPHILSALLAQAGLAASRSASEQSEPALWLTPTFWLPLVAAMLFAVAAVLMKRTGNWKIDIWRISFVCNLITALSFQPFWLQATGPPPWELWWQPAIVAFLFVLGQVFVLISLSHGEISVAAPILGLKILFVPIFLWLLIADRLPTSIWLACSAATLGVVMLNYTETRGAASRVWFSVGCAGAGAAAYALFDVCVQMWAGVWPEGGFLPLVFFFSTALTCGFIPLFHDSLWRLPRAALPTLIGSAVFFALQAIGIVCTVAFWGQAATANVVYSSRGLWSLLLVWLVGGYLGAADHDLTPRVVFVRTSGALVLIGAIMLLVRDG